jgi:hypothetical protein
VPAVLGGGEGFDAEGGGDDGEAEAEGFEDLVLEAAAAAHGVDHDGVAGDGGGEVVDVAGEHDAGFGGGEVDEPGWGVGADDAEFDVVVA